MPPLKFTEVITFSSEDANHPVNNLLKLDTYLKWKSEAGRNEKQEYAILKLEQLSSIQSVDIGNENSAFIEVLVSRDGTDFKVLLVASAFMSPLESRNNSATNRVRMFGIDKLNKNIADQKWDRIKIVCTQPFNKNIQYGLTFIKVYGPEIARQGSGTEVKLGKFTMKEEEEVDSVPVGSFFAKRQESFSSESKSPNRKRSIEEESTSNAPNSGFYQLKKKIKESSLVQNNDPPTTTKPSKPETKKSEETSAPKKRTDSPAPQKRNESPTPKNRNDQNHAVKKAALKASLKVKMKPKTRPFKQLMSNVVFVLSGYQNPKRGKLRDSLIDMGAKYKADWGKGCTHLICAFKNTPKFQAVSGRGKIVNEKWVEESHKKKIRLPWRRYNLEKNDGDESEEEIWASEICPENGDQSENKKGSLSDTDDMEESEVDTDDEIRRALDNEENGKNDKSVNQGEPKTKPNNVKTVAKDLSSDEYDADTDLDEEQEKKDTSSMPLPALKNIFKGKIMYLYGSLLNEDKKRALKRYIVAFEGTVENYMSQNVNFVITDDSWDDNFDNALEENPSLQFVKSQWIWKCCNSEKMVPPQPFLIVPQ